MIQPLLKTEAKAAAHAAVVETPRIVTEMKMMRYTPLPLDTGTPDDRDDRNT